MKIVSVICSTIFLSGGMQFLQAQGLRSTTQFDFWNWYAVKAPVKARISS